MTTDKPEKMKTITNEAITEAGFDLEENGLHVLALCSHLDCEPSDLSLESYDHYGLALYSLGQQQYAIGDDFEADKACEANIRESLWAFNASFLADQTGLPELIFTAMQEKMREGCNDAIYQMVERRFDLLCEEAIAADGRGHFLSGYDGEENEERADLESDHYSDSGTFYIYRVN